MSLETTDIENLHPILKERDEVMEELTIELGRMSIRKDLLDRLCEINVEINDSLHRLDEIITKGLN